MKKYIFLGLVVWIGLSIVFSIDSYAQNAYTLEQIVALAQSNSIGSKQAVNRKENRYWQYRTFLSNYKPQLALNGTLPNYNRSVTPVVQQDGSTAFKDVNISNSNVQLSLSQTVGPTGGNIFINSTLQRFDNFTDKTHRYSGFPFSIGFRQPLFAFNALVWDKKIEPLRYEESTKQYNEDMERVALRASELFFRLLLAQINLDLAQLNQANNDTIYRIAEGRYTLGKIAENELLQLELNSINSSQQVIQAKLDLETTTLNLNTFIGRKDNSGLVLMAPAQIPEFLMDVNIALEQAKAHRQQYVSFKRQQLEAERDVARAKGDNGLNVNLFGSFGVSQVGQTVGSIYQNTQSQQGLQVGFSVPIVDWGRSQSQIKTAAANAELIKSTIEQDQINFEQEIYVKVRQFPILRDQLKSSIRADEVANKRYEIAQQRYLVSKISITDLNIARQEKDVARQRYLQALSSFWQSYYEIRMLTLFDFEKNAEVKY